MVALGFAALGFLLGMLPFSVWVGRLAGKEVRAVGDGNPGAMNAWRAGGAKLGLPALLLDFLKGVVPVGLAVYAGVEGWPLVPVLVAPPLGHAFSPILKFRGGKALAATFGVWAGATAWIVPVVLGGLFVLGKLARIPDAWVVALGGAGALAFVALFFHDAPRATAFALTYVLLLVKQGRELWAGKKP